MSDPYSFCKCSNFQVKLLKKNRLKRMHTAIATFSCNFNILSDQLYLQYSLLLGTLNIFRRIFFSAVLWNFYSRAWSHYCAEYKVLELLCELWEFDCNQFANLQRNFVKLLQESVSQTFNGEADLELKEKALQVSAQYIA